MIAHIAAQRAEHNIPIRVSCTALGMSESWYYEHHNHPEAARSTRHRRLVAAVGKSFHASDGTYGSPRVVVDLWEAGWQVSVNTVAVIMAEHGWVARPKRVRRSLTKQGKRPAYPDLVGRQFTVDRPDQVWVGDVTLIRTLEGPLYAATVIDLFARRMLALATSAHHDAELSCGALKMAIAARGGNVRGVIWHTDRGSEGGFNWSSQHLVITEVCDGTSQEAVAGGAGGRQAAVGGGSGVAGADAFTWAA